MEFISKINPAMLILKEIHRRRETWKIAKERETTLKAKKRQELDPSTDNHIKKLKFSNKSGAGRFVLTQAKFGTRRQ